MSLKGSRPFRWRWCVLVSVAISKHPSRF